MLKVTGPKVQGASWVPLLGLKEGERTDVTLWLAPVQFQVTVPPLTTVTVEGVKV